MFPATLRQEFAKEKDVFMLPFMVHSGIVQFLEAGRMHQNFVLVLELAAQVSFCGVFFLCVYSSAILALIFKKLLERNSLNFPLKETPNPLSDHIAAVITAFKSLKSVNSYGKSSYTLLLDDVPA